MILHAVHELHASATGVPHASVLLATVVCWMLTAAGRQDSGNLIRVYGVRTEASQLQLARQGKFHAADARTGPA